MGSSPIPMDELLGRLGSSFGTAALGAGGILLVVLVLVFFGGRE